MYLLMIVALAMLASCSSGTDDRLEFAKKFGKLVSENKVDSIHALYPASEVCDSFALSLNEDEIAIGNQNDDGTCLVSLGNGADITVKKGADNAYSIISSHGVFAFPKEIIELAQGTGMTEEGIDDVELAKRVADDGFKSWLIGKFKKDFARVLVVKDKAKTIKEPEHSLDEAIYGYTIENTSDQTIAGKDYVVVFNVYDMRMGNYNTTENGKDVAPKSTVQILVPVVGYSDVEKAYVKFNLTDDQLIEKYFKPTGSEYINYKKENNNK